MSPSRALRRGILHLPKVFCDHWPKLFMKVSTVSGAGDYGHVESQRRNLRGICSSGRPAKKKPRTRMHGASKIQLLTGSEGRRGSSQQANLPRFANKRVKSVVGIRHLLRVNPKGVKGDEPPYRRQLRHGAYRGRVAAGCRPDCEVRRRTISARMAASSPGRRGSCVSRIKAARTEADATNTRHPHSPSGHRWSPAW